MKSLYEVEGKPELSLVHHFEAAGDVQDDSFSHGMYLRLI